MISSKSMMPMSRMGSVLPFYMDDVFIIKAAHHMNDCFGAADIGQELVAQPLTMTGALDQTGDVHEFDHSRSGLFGMVQIAQPVQAGV